MTAVRAYRTKSGKSVRAYSRAGGAKLRPTSAKAGSLSMSHAASRNRAVYLPMSGDNYVRGLKKMDRQASHEAFMSGFRHRMQGRAFNPLAYGAFQGEYARGRDAASHLRRSNPQPQGEARPVRLSTEFGFFGAQPYG